MSRPKAKIRVVDGDKAVFEAVAQILDREGYEVVEAEAPVGPVAPEAPVDGLAASEPLAHLPYGEAKRLSMYAFERRYLTSLLKKNNNNVSSAARSAGLDRSNFRRLLKQYGVGHWSASREPAPPPLEAGSSLSGL